MAPNPASRNPATRVWLLALLGALAVLLVYARVRHADFNWDDDAHITGNPTIVGPLGLKEIWTSGKANYFPLTMTSFWVQHQLWGLSPGPYHVVTLLFHVAATVTLFVLLRRLQVPGAWLGAMLWALHPVQVESVAWICELKNTQSAFFYLLAILWFVRWMERPGGLRFGRDYALALTAAVLAILSKSSTVMLPVVLGLIGWWRGHRRWRDVVWLAPFLAVSLAASGWTIWEQKVNSMASGPEWGHGLASRLMIAGKVPWFYLGKLLWPEPLIFIYPRWDVNALGFVHWVPLAATVALGVLLWCVREGRGQPLFLGLAYFFVSLFPVLGLFDVFFFRYSFVGDHFQYLASMGPLVLIGAGVAVVARRFGPRERAIHAAAAAALLGALGILTWKQVAIYQTRETLWRDTVNLNPRAWIARVNLGSELMSTGRPAEAIPHFQAALELRPDDALTEANWGAALAQLGKFAEALPHLQRAVSLMPKLAEAHNSLGVALVNLGRLDEAVRALRTAVELRADFHGAHANLGDAHVRAQRWPEALEHFKTAVRLAPDTALYHVGAARALAQLGRVQEAAEHYATAAKLNPQDASVLRTLADLLSQHGAHGPAADYAAAAVRVRPDADGHFVLANALLRAGRAPDAIAHYEQALRLRPDFVDARANLGTTLYQLGRAADAVPHYAAVVQRSPRSPGAHNNLASALLQAGRLPEALEHYAVAVTLQPDYLDARLNYARALEAAGRTADAIAQLEAVVALRPDHAVARENLARLRDARPAAASGR